MRPMGYTRLESHLEPRGRRVRGQNLDGKGVEERGLPPVTRGKPIAEALTAPTDNNPSFLQSLSIFMLVSLHPSDALGFPRTPSPRFSFYSFAPLIQGRLFWFSGSLTLIVKRTLAISNNNTQPMAFKVKTTAPKACLHSLGFGSMGAYRLRSGSLEVLRKTKCRPCGARPERRGPRRVMYRPQKRDEYPKCKPFDVRRANFSLPDGHEEPPLTAGAMKSF